MDFFVLLTLGLVFLSFKQVLTFPEGPGWHACHGLVPNVFTHGEGQNSVSPYEIILSSYSYTANTPNITATIQKKQSTTVGFKGFMVSAYDSKGQPVGKFLAGAENRPMCDYYTATGQSNGKIKDSVDLNWIPPATPVGDIIFKATILQSFNTFWLRVPALTLTGPGVADDQKPPPPVNTGSSTDQFDFTKCGKERGCLRFPSSCNSESSCQGVVFWKDAGDYIEFDVSVNGSFRSVGIGFSKDNLMSDDSIFGCFIKNNFEEFNADNYYSPKNPQNILFSKIIERKPIPDSVILDGASFNALQRLKCKIRRKKSVAGEEDKFFDISAGNSYYLMMSISDYSVNWTRYEGLYYHGFTKVITKSPVSIIYPPAPTEPPSTGQGQLKLPGGCEKSECQGMVTWREADDSMEISMKAAKGFDYVGFGLSHDRNMGDDSIIICSTLDPIPKAVNYYSRGAGLPDKIGEQGITMGQSSSENGVQCVFKRKKIVDNNEIYDISKDKKYHLFLAVGKIKDNVPQYHGPDKRSTAEKFTLLESVSIPPTPPKTTKAPNKPSNIDFDDCGIKKSCFRSPANCNPESACKFSATWKKVDDSYEFEISGASEFQYVALGLSFDKKMGDDSVLVCNDILSDQQVVIYYTEDKSPKRLGNDGITVLNTKFENGIYCKFRKTINSNSKNIYSLEDGLEYTPLLAAGPSRTARNSKDIAYHGSNKIASIVQIKMGKLVNIGGDTETQKLVIAHGALMTAAWLIFAVFGIFNARYFKTLYANKICELDAWFVVSFKKKKKKIQGFLPVSFNFSSKIVAQD
ncbi:DgyrCDS2746 [Dimorphilus gyrociliatus]|uniref:DgyrCDS2746 n=1 Tax=Dimorphilus gyrociliatus TaxID=2664684 RepID=A0A7I8VCZ5_9ANNE|nr:DgyrCDS2746 [Dimorphilus gyrociliatus]